MRIVLLEQANFTSTTRVLSDEIARRGLYLRGDGAIVQSNQVAARARKYPQVFEIVDSQNIRLIGNLPSRATGQDDDSVTTLSDEVLATPEGKRQRTFNHRRERRDEAGRKFGLDPVVDEHTEILILGTLPSDESLSKAQYYAKPSNDFWKLLGAVLNERLTDVPYETKIRTLSARRIGLWDVYRNCVRPGSMDKDISEKELNDFEHLKAVAPRIRLVCFNGKEAGQSEELLRGLGHKTRILPSSSGANRGNQEERLRCWKSIVQ